uniref:Uncharacterized protein n=1 Tax=Timema poppense TaxID=170557 RepID=A0A7R9D7B4_TIMPO|nr:unnamed protein product [Timema poppensis]
MMLGGSHRALQGCRLATGGSDQRRKENVTPYKKKVTELKRQDTELDITVTFDSQNLDIFINVDCQKSAVSCQSAPKKPWGYCTNSDRAPPQAEDGCSPSLYVLGALRTRSQAATGRSNRGKVPGYQNTRAGPIGTGVTSVSTECTVEYGDQQGSLVCEVFVCVMTVHLMNHRDPWEVDKLPDSTSEECIECLAERRKYKEAVFHQLQPLNVFYFETERDEGGEGERKESSQDLEEGHKRKAWLESQIKSAKKALRKAESVKKKVEQERRLSEITKWNIQEEREKMEQTRKMLEEERVWIVNENKLIKLEKEHIKCEKDSLLAERNEMEAYKKKLEEDIIATQENIKKSRNEIEKTDNDHNQIHYGDLGKSNEEQNKIEEERRKLQEERRKIDEANKEIINERNKLDEDLKKFEENKRKYEDYVKSFESDRWIRSEEKKQTKEENLKRGRSNKYKKEKQKTYEKGPILEGDGVAWGSEETKADEGIITIRNGTSVVKSDVRPVDSIEKNEFEDGMGGTSNKLISVKDSINTLRSFPPSANSSRSRHSTLRSHIVRPSAEEKVKTLWAVTKISVFSDSSRTYQIMQSFNKRPKLVPEETECVFVRLGGSRRHSHKKHS